MPVFLHCPPKNFKINSAKFQMLNGVKQGGIISPKLFTLYIDELFERLKNSGYGCTISGKYVGAIGYADDLTLITISTCKLDIQAMLEICANFATENDLLFDADKTTLLVYDDTVKEHTVNFVGTNVSSSASAKHLGNKLCAGSLCHLDVDFVISDYIRRTNTMFNIFKKVNVSTKIQLLKTFCYSFYGSPIWFLNLSKKLML